MAFGVSAGHFVFWFLSGLGAVWGGLLAVRAIAKWFAVDDHAIELVNLDIQYYRENKARPTLITGVHLSAILTNSGSAISYVGVDRIDSALGGVRADPDSVVWRVLPLRPGIAVNLSADNIKVKIERGAFLEGRIDWKLKIGTEEKDLKTPFRIKGSIAVNTTKKEPMFVWVPDADSEHPIAMNVGAADHTEGGLDLRAISDRLPRH